MTNLTIAPTGRRPIGTHAMTPAERKARQRDKHRKTLLTSPPDTWTYAVCLAALSNDSYSTDLQHAAWLRLGRIRLFSCDCHAMPARDLR